MNHSDLEVSCASKSRQLLSHLREMPHRALSRPTMTTSGCDLKGYNRDPCNNKIDLRRHNLHCTSGCGTLRQSATFQRSGKRKILMFFM